MTIEELDQALADLRNEIVSLRAENQSLQTSLADSATLKDEALGILQRKVDELEQRLSTEGVLARENALAEAVAKLDDIDAILHPPATE